MTTFPLGKKPFVADSRDFEWAELRKPLVAAGLMPTVPATFGHGNTYTNWQMLANGPDPTAPGQAKNGAGCCVWSSAANETKIALTDAGEPQGSVSALFNGATTISDYSACTGYNPTTGEHDEGTEIRQALLYRQKTGIVDTKGVRHKIGPFVKGEPGNLQHLLEMVYFFEALPMGMVVTQAQMDQFSEAEAAGHTPVWDYVAGSNQIGGHCIPECGRPDSSHITAITWRLRILLTPRLLEKQCDEVWGYLTPERISKVTGKSYEGATEAQLEEYVHVFATAVANGDTSVLLPHFAA